MIEKSTTNLRNNVIDCFVVVGIVNAVDAIHKVAVAVVGLAIIITITTIVTFACNVVALGVRPSLLLVMLLLLIGSLLCFCAEFLVLQAQSFSIEFVPRN